MFFGHEIRFRLRVTTVACCTFFNRKSDHVIQTKCTSVCRKSLPLQIQRKIICHHPHFALSADHTSDNVCGFAVFRYNVYIDNVKVFKPLQICQQSLITFKDVTCTKGGGVMWETELSIARTTFM